MLIGVVDSTVGKKLLLFNIFSFLCLKMLACISGKQKGKCFVVTIQINSVVTLVTILRKLHFSGFSLKGVPQRMSSC